MKIPYVRVHGIHFCLGYIDKLSMHACNGGIIEPFRCQNLVGIDVIFTKLSQIIFSTLRMIFLNVCISANQREGLSRYRCNIMK